MAQSLYILLGLKLQYRPVSAAAVLQPLAEWKYMLGLAKNGYFVDI